MQGWTPKGRIRAKKNVWAVRLERTCCALMRLPCVFSSSPSMEVPQLELHPVHPSNSMSTPYGPYIKW